jgi:predicted acyl esterase
MNAGPYRISKEVHARTDAVHFTSEPLVNGVTLAGHASANIFCSFEGASTVDYVVRLCEVFQDGTTVVFAEGVTRVSDHHPAAGAVVHVDIGSVGRIITSGQRLRIYIGSSAFPRWEVNSGSGSNDPTQSEHLIWCAPGTALASYLTLPVYPDVIP